MKQRKSKTTQETKKGQSFSTGICSLGDPDVYELKEAFSQLERFICAMCTKKKIEKVDEVYADLFYKSKSKKHEKTSFVKKLYGSTLPPCSRVLWQKCQRT